MFDDAATPPCGDARRGIALIQVWFTSFIDSLIKKYGNLEIDVTVEDPKAYTRPWTVKVKQRLMPDTQLIEFICQDKDAVHYTDSK